MIQIPLQEPVDQADHDVALDGPQEAFGKDGVYASANLAGGESTNTLVYTAPAALGAEPIARLRLEVDVTSNGPVTVHAAILLDGASEHEFSEAYPGGSATLGFVAVSVADWNGAVPGASVRIENANGDLIVGVDDTRIFWEALGAPTHRPSAPHMIARSRR